MSRAAGRWKRIEMQAGDVSGAKDVEACYAEAKVERIADIYPWALGM